MSNLSILDIETETRYILGSDTDEDSARIRRWLKQGYEFITAPNIYKHPELEHSETIALVAGAVQSTVAVWNAVELVRYYEEVLASVTAISMGWRLRPTSYRMLLDRALRIEGAPRRYAFRGNQFLLDRSVDTSTVGNGLLVAGYRKPAAIDWTDSNETTDIREEWDPLLALAGAMFGFTWKGEFEKAHGARDSLGRLVNDMTPIQTMSAADWEPEMQVESGNGMRRGRGR